MLLLCVVLAAGAMAMRDWPAFPREQFDVILVLAALTFLTEALAFELPLLGTVSLAFAVDLAALLFLGPLPAALVAAAGAVIPQDIRNRKPLVAMGYNIAQLVLSILVAGAVFLQLDGAVLSLLPGSNLAVLAVVPAAAAALAFHGMNTVLVTFYVSLAKGLTPIEVWRGQHFGAYLVNFVGLALLGSLMAQLMTVAGWMGIVLLLLPLAVARQTFQVYQDLSQAYSETIRSLVAAIEAKDPYTRGHSERVAGYSRLVGKAIALPAPTAQTLDFAALLHDIGKIGVPKETLVKEGELSCDEFVVIRRHPEVGKSVLEAVEFLEDIVPLVFAHHERPDGTGYPLGLRLEEIPLESRILAVADCFDAMTSDRAYRRPMNIEQARVELARVAGTQLDATLVDAFLGQIAEYPDVESLTRGMGVAVAHSAEDN